MSKESDSMLEDFFNSITPEHNFNIKEIPQDPDYSNDDYWGTLPSFSSVAELLPKELNEENNKNEVGILILQKIVQPFKEQS